MKNPLAKSSKLIIFALALIGMAMVHPALADDHGRSVGRGHDRDWDRHARYAHEWRAHHPVVVPGVVYAPPAVYEPLPPQPSGINLIIPFNIR